MSIKYSTVRWLTYDRNGMYIGDFEDRQCAEEWANKHGGRIDKHSIEHEESRIYDSILREEVRKEILREVINFIKENRYCTIDYELIEEAYKRFGVEVEE